MTSPLWMYQVDIYEPLGGSGGKYPVVQHNFYGRNPQEALHYFHSHVKTDAVLREGIEKSKFRGIMLDIRYRMVKVKGGKPENGVQG